MTQMINNADIQKIVLKLIMNQSYRFSEQDIIDLALDFFEDVEHKTIEKIVSKTIDYCKREIHVIEVVDGVYEINPERKELVKEVFNHTGVTI